MPAFLLLPAQDVIAQTQTFYLDFNASSLNGSGSSSSPFKTLDDAITNTQGDVDLVISRGASAESLTINEAGRFIRLEKEAGVIGNVRIGSAGYALTVAVNDGGSVVPGSGNYAPGNLQLEAEEDTGWSFLRWEDGVSGSSNPITITFSGNLLAFARFSPNDSADLRVFGASSEVSSGKRGDPLTVSWSVENYGGENAEASWKDGVYISTDDAWDESDKLIGDKTRASALASMAAYQESLLLAIPDVAPGRYWLLVETDFEEGVEESVETVADNTTLVGELLVQDVELSNE